MGLLSKIFSRQPVILPQTLGLQTRQCKHEWQSVVYGSEWEVECKKCDENVFDLYPRDEAVKIIRTF